MSEAVPGPDYELREVPLDAMQIPDWDIRDHRPEEDILAIASSMQDEGQIMPVLLGPLDDDSFELVDGVHRYLAADRLGWHSLQGLVIHGDADRYTAGVIANLSRLDLGNADKLRVFRYLYGELGMGVAPVADKLGISERQAQTYRQILEGHDVLAEMVAHDDVQLEVAAQAAKIPDRDEAVTVCQDVQTRGLNVEHGVEMARNAKQRVEAEQAMESKYGGEQREPSTSPDVDAGEQQLESGGEFSSEPASPADGSANPPAGGRSPGPEPQGQPGETAMQQQGEPDTGGSEVPPEPEGPTCAVCGQPHDPDEYAAVLWPDEIADELGTDRFTFCWEHSVMILNTVGELQDMAVGDADAQ